MVLQRPERFLQLLAKLRLQDEREPSLSLLLDKAHDLGENYVPQDLVSLTDYPELTLARSGLQLRSLVLPALLEMNAAAEADGVVLTPGSAYRSFSYQRDVFRRYAARDSQAGRYSARAGESQHQLGLAIDFVPISRAFAGTAAGQWLTAHALEYGFSLSYPEGRESSTGYIYEPWHYRYVGPLIAELLRSYFNEFQQKFFVFWHAAATELEHHLTDAAVAGVE